MQKRVLCMHSLAGFGRCGLTIALPVLSVMGHEAACIPTVALSTHTGGFGAPEKLDLTAFCEGAAQHYNSQKIKFDAIYAGYMASIEQLEVAILLYRDNEKALFLLDPVMGDGGKMYANMPINLPLAMKKAAKHASVITPNETETALLLGEEYSPIYTEAQANKKLDALSLICYGDIAITGITLENKKTVIACKKSGGEKKLIEYEAVNGSMHGTGDLFASALCGALMNGEELFCAVKRASGFVSECAKAAVLQNRDERLGMPFESLLHLLIQNGTYQGE